MDQNGRADTQEWNRTSHKSYKDLSIARHVTHVPALNSGTLLQQSQPALLRQILGGFAVEGPERQLVVVPARPLRLQIKDDRVNFLERALVLLPHEKLRYLLRELPALFKVYVSIWQTANKERDSVS